MNPPAKRLPAAFYRNVAGHEPVREWLRSAALSDDDRRRIGEDIKTVEFGWPVGMPTCRPLGGGLWEVRTTIKDRIARVLFCVAEGHMVLLHGFIKKSQRTPDNDIRLARERQAQVEKRR
ncbi:MAG: type II toxin-antitoxin system RelE/ParE family toxin [Alphaproteobacteria bacterium]|nr:type II toxin-antitoxin system RelE/ParE family toxin [Alphaproteobacteria bacterium]